MYRCSMCAFVTSRPPSTPVGYVRGYFIGCSNNEFQFLRFILDDKTKQSYAERSFFQISKIQNDKK